MTHAFRWADHQMPASTARILVLLLAIFVLGSGNRHSPTDIDFSNAPSIARDEVRQAAIHVRETGGKIVALTRKAPLSGKAYGEEEPALTAKRFPAATTALRPLLNGAVRDGSRLDGHRDYLARAPPALG